MPKGKNKPLLYFKDATKFDRSLANAGAGVDKARKPVQQIFKKELSKLLPQVRRQVSKDTGLLRRSLSVQVDDKNFAVTAGYRIDQPRYSSRRVPAILEEYGGAGKPPRSRALTKAFANNEKALVNRLIKAAGKRITEAMAKNAGK